MHLALVAGNELVGARIIDLGAENNFDPCPSTWLACVHARNLGGVHGIGGRHTIDAHGFLGEYCQTTDPTLLLLVIMYVHYSKGVTCRLRSGAKLALAGLDQTTQGIGDEMPRERVATALTHLGRKMAQSVRLFANKLGICSPHPSFAPRQHMTWRHCLAAKGHLHAI
jgi:hypothetical protein